MPDRGVGHRTPGTIGNCCRPRNAEQRSIPRVGPVRGENLCIQYVPGEADSGQSPGPFPLRNSLRLRRCNAISQPKWQQEDSRTECAISRIEEWGIPVGRLIVSDQPPLRSGRREIVRQITVRPSFVAAGFGLEKSTE